ncbi:PID-CTERM protein-sorting domain-containing protein [Cytophaga hutchinsonii]|uniref:VPDSG-CTERM protein sorting domain-containing protein n=1 Tax=Cytophaga hutchinsonii (strain ATCC 33406 / DSM 1761 / CIP 103989 / NBRC 15051 / NCIMB 9469 / D465) TaxID=269798 RepID=A0A6N4SPG8_CYTH3|nr:hypothetical protein [Cytophaga hutchinsonii]ABG58155.1 hypothetical protein CHU_0872 [Cytophaga hutchinsonii ATCC 33406]ABG58158.1 hypothetical protein CHU_0876 [Cytophaga hutchinsonii ATCC 33406]
MKKLSKTILFICLCGMSIASFAQAGGAEQPCDGDDPFDCPEIPIDGGASFLLLAGAGAVVTRMIKKRSSNA